MILKFGFLLLLASAVHAESVGTAFRTITLNPEEVVVELLISTDPDTTVDESVALLSSLGIAPRDLKSVGTLRDTPDRLGWQYSFTRPYKAMTDLVKQIENTRGLLREKSVPLSYQFFLRPLPATVEAAKRRVLSELVAEAKRNANASGKLRSVVIEPTPENIDSGRASMLFGNATGALQYHFSVIAVFETE